MSINRTFVAKHGHHQLVDRRSKTSINIAIILIDAIYKEFYIYWSRYSFCTSTNSKTPFPSNESLIKPLACVLFHSSTNAFPIRWLSEKTSRSREGPWVKRQKDGWLDAVRETTLRTSTSVFFYRLSIGVQSFSIVSDLNERESRLCLDGSVSLDCQLDGW